MTLTEQFDEALRAVNEKRGSVYGHPADDFARAAELKAAISGCKDARIRHAMEMICAKLSRLVETPDHLDSWIDIAGYARTARMIIDRDRETKPDG